MHVCAVFELPSLMDSLPVPKISLGSKIGTCLYSVYTKYMHVTTVCYTCHQESYYELSKLARSV